MGYDYRTYWEKRIYDNHIIEEYQRSLFGKYQIPGKTLELGCGCGRLSALFEDYVGVDINVGSILKAEEIYPHKEFRVADIVASDIEQSDNLVTCTALQHIPPSLIEGVAEKMEAKNLMLFESNFEKPVKGCFSHDYEKLFGRLHYKESVPNTPTWFMVFRGEK